MCQLFNVSESKEEPEGRNKQVEIIFKALICLCPFFPSCNVLKDARQKFRSVLVEATVKLDELVKKIGKAVEDSKPYWEARRVARQVRTFCLVSWRAHTDGVAFLLLITS